MNEEQKNSKPEPRVDEKRQLLEKNRLLENRIQGLQQDIERLTKKSRQQQLDIDQLNWILNQTEGYLRNRDDSRNSLETRLNNLQRTYDNERQYLRKLKKDQIKVKKQFKSQQDNQMIYYRL